MRNDEFKAQAASHSSIITPHSSLLSYAFSSPAYFSTSFFWPKPGKLTVSLAESPAPSRRSTSPRPYLGCLTCVPGTKSPPEDVEDDAAPPARVVAFVRAGGGCWRGASGCADCLAAAALRLIWSPRWRKNSAMESTLS